MISHITLNVNLLIAFTFSFILILRWLYDILFIREVLPSQ